MRRKKYDAVIFDLDGTLLNTLDDLKNSVNYALSACGMPQRSYEEVRHLGNASPWDGDSVPEPSRKRQGRRRLWISPWKYWDCCMRIFEW